MPKVLDKPLPDAIVQGRLISAREAMTLLGISRRTLYTMTLHSKPSERIPSYKLGKSRKYKLDELLWWLDARRESV